jgi:outer membrane protein W
MKKIILLILTTSTIFAGGVFSVGSKNVGINIGTDSSFGNSYTVLGANVNYFIIDNLSIGASYQAFLGGNPSINQITVPVTYHIPIEGTTYRPYLGAFYNQTFIEDPYKDYNIYGGRVGLSLQTSLNSFMSFGWVQEFSNSGENTKNRGYPEISAGLSF